MVSTNTYYLYGFNAVTLAERIRRSYEKLATAVQTIRTLKSCDSSYVTILLLKQVEGS